MRRPAVLALLAFVSCGPMGMAELQLVVVPRMVPDDGREAIIKISATAANGAVGVGSVRVTSTIGTLKDADLTLDPYGTASTTFTCNKATEPACAGPVTFEATWNSEKVVIKAEATGTVVTVTAVTGGGAGGGAGGGGGTDLSAIVCPTAADRVFVYENAMPTAVVDEPLTKSSQFACTTARCEFMEFQGGGRIESLVLLSVGSPAGVALAGNTQFSTGMIGTATVYRLQYASLMRDCGSSAGHQFKLETFVVGSTNALTHGRLLFTCNPMSGTAGRLTGCATF